MGICPEDLDLAQGALALRDADGLPFIEILGADDLRVLHWNVSEDAIGMVSWFRTIMPAEECAQDCGFLDCEHRKTETIEIRRVPQLKLLNGDWGKYTKNPDDPGDESGYGRHFSWEPQRNAPEPEDYTFHRAGVGACAYADLRHPGDLGPIFVTEGMKKGLVGHLRGLSVVVLGSVSQGGTGKRGRLKDIISGGSGRYELETPVIKLLGDNEVIWAFDGDIVTKDSVRRQLAASMACVKIRIGVAPSFILFPPDKGTKSALDSILLTNKDKDAMEVLAPFQVRLDSTDNLGHWLAGDRAADVVAIAYEYFREMYSRGAMELDPDAALRSWLQKATNSDRAQELLAAYDPKVLDRKRRDALQAFLDEKYVLVQIGEGGASILMRDGPRLVKPIFEDDEQRALERECFHWWKGELGHEPDNVRYGHDVSRFKLRHRPEEVSPCSWPWEKGLTRWIMPEPRLGAFPATNKILGRLREIDENGEEVPLTEESRRATLAFFGGIFMREPSRQVGVLRGNGGDGKGTLARLVGSAFGGFDGSYSVAFAVGDQTFNPQNGHWAEPLVGKYLCVLFDTKRARILEDERMRTLTGGDSLSVNVKHGPQFNAPNRTRWLIIANVTMEITGLRADLSRVFPMLFAAREDELVTDGAFEKEVLSEVREFINACVLAYSKLCPKGGDVPLTPGIVRVRDQMVAAGEAELEAFAEGHLMFEPNAILKGTDLTRLLESGAPRSWERTQRQRFRDYLNRRLKVQGQKNHRIGDKFVTGWKGVRLKTQF